MCPRQIDGASKTVAGPMVFPPGGGRLADVRHSVDAGQARNEIAVDGMYDRSNGG
jgi:hypothetical protein